MSDPAAEEPIGTCHICGREIRAVIEQRSSVSVIRAARAATERHLRSHTLAERARAELRELLPRLTDRQRRELVKDIYTDLLGEWGDYDRRGVYGIDEALGSTAMYRLWHAASSCGARACRH
jgi:hypothetical protein